ncbi:MAG: Flp pilus assembly complex ATPase component TadA [Phreatobacter sp.]|jgi:type II secretory ATPase GspE/PulE/Tfp pilus assembly ATPase PilB-like protein|nr:Flp pilus assembly complex ATPase component TadA [Phreatobacter sp.]
MSPETLALFTVRDAIARWPNGILNDGERHRFTERLVLAGFVDERSAKAALFEQKINPDTKIGTILVRNGHATHEDITAFIENENPERLVYETVSSSRIPHEMLREYQLILNAETRKVLYVSTGGSQKKAQELLNIYYPDRKHEFIDYKASLLTSFIEKMAKVGTEIKTGDKVRAEDLADRLVHQAIERRASDIHITPRAHSFSVFFRILGVRELIYEGAIDVYRQMVTQIKDRAKMDMQETRKPQDGKFDIEHGGKMVDVRVATIPVQPAYEGVTLRILDPDRITPNLDNIGITEVAKWKEAIELRSGLCLITGRTGSGKTTTLRSSILKIDRMSKKIVTVEDPVEYVIPYVEQVTVNELVDLTFATASRAFLRGNPDVVVLGEVRDMETAANAIRLAETGHLVIATLHATDIVTALMRLREFDVKASTLKQLVKCVLVQDLIRSVCPHCKNDAFKRVECKVCHGTGYAGQTIVSECEYFPFPDTLTPLISRIEHGTDHEITWKTMLEDAILKAEMGITDEQELKRMFPSELAAYRSRYGHGSLAAPPTAPS